MANCAMQLAQYSMHLWDVQKEKGKVAVITAASCKKKKKMCVLSKLSY